MERERRSLWVIIIVLFLVGIFQLIGTRIGVGPWDLNRSGGWLTNVENYRWWYFLFSPAICALASSVVYAFLHYRRRYLTLWLMAVQMLVILMVSYYPLTTAPFLVVAWLMLLSVVLRSKPRDDQEHRADVLDDI